VAHRVHFVGHLVIDRRLGTSNCDAHSRTRHVSPGDMVSFPSGLATIRHLGPMWAVRRAVFELSRRTGWLDFRLKQRSVHGHNLEAVLRPGIDADSNELLRSRREGVPQFFWDGGKRDGILQDLGTCFGDDDVIESADRIEGGDFRLFENLWVHRGEDPDWHRDVLQGSEWPATESWTKVSDFDHGDIILVWEPSRFSFVYPLSRAYWRTGDERYAERFWTLVESWSTANPPFKGPNWRCGQETSVRLMALSFGLRAFLQSDFTTPQRLSLLLNLVAASAQRIEAGISYALSQSNNHGVSEATGLWTAGILYPELAGSSRWRRKGRRLLIKLAAELIYRDGAFSQHSFNYQRLMLDDYLWAVRLGEVNGQQLPRELYDRLLTSVNLLYQLQDVDTGRLPNFGNNDSAHILPLTSCEPRDFRPVIQCVRFLTSGIRTYESGPWDESLLWLFGRPALRSPVEAPRRSDLRAVDGGYYTLRGKRGFSFVHATTFIHRPGHADQLHVDLWMNGINVALDPGTFSYNAAPPWDVTFSQTRFHNTVTVDDLDQMDRVRRFLWLPWCGGGCSFMKTSPSGNLAYWEGWHDGYERLKIPVTARRGIVRVTEDLWVVIDRLASTDTHRYVLHWNLADFPYEFDQVARRITLTTPKGPFTLSIAGEPQPKTELTRADTHSPNGWQAKAYQDRVPVLAVDATTESSSALIISALAAGDDWRLSLENDVIVRNRDTTVRITLAEVDGPCLIEDVGVEHRRESGESWRPVS
jgi:hypothetical protein